MTEATCMGTREVGRYVVEIHHDDEWRNLARDRDNVGRVSIPDEHGRIHWDWQDDAMDYREAREYAGEPILAIPLSIWTHSYTIVRPQPGNWDGADGFYWAPLSKVATEGFTDVAALKACMLAEVKELASELEGDVWGYVVRHPDGQVEESVWGFIGDRDCAETEGVSTAEWANLRDAINWAALPQWVRDAVLIRGDEWETYPPAREVIA